MSLLQTQACLICGSRTLGWYVCVKSQVSATAIPGIRIEPSPPSVRQGPFCMKCQQALLKTGATATL
jgi:hypothetical protein